MKSIQFETVIGTDHVIRPPAGVALPEGVIEVTVRPLQSAPMTDSIPCGVRHDAWLLELAAEAEQIGAQVAV